MIRLFRQYVSPRKIIFIMGEGVLIFLAVTVASFFILGRSVGFVYMLELIWMKALLISCITMLSLYFNDLYEFKRSDNAIDLASRLIQAIGKATVYETTRSSSSPEPRFVKGIRRSEEG